MAYTIISQNNTTTTLSDENGNVITVPARVTLATSTDYTIIKVNNNSVDLEDGDGKIIRGVPACVVLAGEGGGGDEYLPLAGGTMTGTITLGSSADIVPTGSSNSIGTAQHPFSTIYASVLSGGSQYGRFMIPVADQSTFGFFIALVDSMPTARQDLEAMIFQYMGVTDSNYTHGYFYECVTDDNTTWYWKQLDVQPTPETVKVNTTATLAVADWSSNTQTVSVTGMTADGVVLVSPTPANQSAYTSAGILCTAQAAGSLTFTCDTVPSADITVTVVML